MCQWLMSDDLRRRSCLITISVMRRLALRGSTTRKSSYNKATLHKVICSASSLASMRPHLQQSRRQIVMQRRPMTLSQIWSMGRLLHGTPSSMIAPLTSLSPSLSVQELARSTKKTTCCWTPTDFHRLCPSNTMHFPTKHIALFLPRQTHPIAQSAHSNRWLKTHLQRAAARHVPIANLTLKCSVTQPTAKEDGRICKHRPARRSRVRVKEEACREVD